ncbi:MAG: DegT/DnrJ/EryC1/StrS aminotransferase family protein [Candidatus Wolfebacteria bacterium GW2011_GWA1_44_24]|uniref:DegT/DnrJ/EryC1/StrS aminotransferase family protein n=1 Tax=Candidatus Wolfebacteria bacterium GW2011_GWB1_41_12 TaxID=1619006 RepID=A0A0G0XN91_9BACT|nr:MAG: DegT/DnrJ/EryC1/StrS aminotransferase family protein [Candidatus Wolfebacteria bacterium GW2011_GWB1_41_12]KKT56673.1 MAG: DegT/DnrJ/EryC1/StrS aminotransferase family protein [Candidatus Wolfebacteria bacterium GW2011_GWA1_44_24]
MAILENFINQMEPWFDEKEEQAISEYLKSGGWVTEFKKTREFEKMIAEYTGAKYCSVVSNGTISLTLALIACGIGPGDEVIVPDYTMVASANAVKLAGAEVVFADINPDNLCLDFELMKKAVSPRTKAIMLVTINGRYPSNLEEFVSFCKEKEIKLIEDAAQSLGSFKNGKHLGTFGDIGSFSFSAPKVISTGQGGALITNDEILIERIQKLRDFGREKPGADRYLTMGWNFKFTDIQAIIGTEQMKKLPWRVQRKKDIYALYKKNLEGVAGISFIPTNLENTSPWFIDILVENGKREDLIEFLKNNQIGSRPFYPALHAEPVYNRSESHPVAQKIAAKGLWLPSSSKLTDEEIARVCDAIKDFFKQ